MFNLDNIRIPFSFIKYFGTQRSTYSGESIYQRLQRELTTNKEFDFGLGHNSDTSTFSLDLFASPFELYRKEIQILKTGISELETALASERDTSKKRREFGSHLANKLFEAHKLDSNEIESCIKLDFDVQDSTLNCSKQLRTNAIKKSLEYKMIGKPKPIGTFIKPPQAKLFLKPMTTKFYQNSGSKIVKAIQPAIFRTGIPTKVPIWSVPKRMQEEKSKFKDSTVVIHKRNELTVAKSSQVCCIPELQERIHISDEELGKEDINIVKKFTCVSKYQLTEPCKPMIRQNNKNIINNSTKKVMPSKLPLPLTITKNYKRPTPIISNKTSLVKNSSNSHSNEAKTIVNLLNSGVKNLEKNVRKKSYPKNLGYRYMKKNSKIIIKTKVQGNAAEKLPGNLGILVPYEPEKSMIRDEIGLDAYGEYHRDCDMFVNCCQRINEMENLNATVTKDLKTALIAAREITEVTMEIMHCMEQTKTHKPGTSSGQTYLGKVDK